MDTERGNNKSKNSFKHQTSLQRIKFGIFKRKRSISDDSSCRQNLKAFRWDRDLSVRLRKLTSEKSPQQKVPVLRLHLQQHLVSILARSAKMLLLVLKLEVADVALVTRMARDDTMFQEKRYLCKDILRREIR